MKESHLRSVIKGISWRVIGTMDTMMLSFVITGEFTTALKIGFTEFFTKIALYYLHERVWAKLKIGITKVEKPDGVVVLEDKHWKSLVKGFSWRFFGTMDTILLATLWTGDYSKALGIGFAELFTKVFLYYLHERVWHRIKWGKTEVIVSTPEDKIPTDLEFPKVTNI